MSESPMSAILTESLVLKTIPVIEGVYRAMLNAGFLKRPDLHMVILDPTKVFAVTPYFEEAVLFQHSFTDPSGWENPYNKFALKKAEVTWRTGLSTRVIRECTPHLLVKGDTRYGGSVNVNGIIVACSGVQPWFDEMFAGIEAMLLQGFANEYMQTVIIPGDEDFIGGTADAS